MSDSKGIIAIAVALIGLVPSVLAFFQSRDAQQHSREAVVESSDAKKAAGTESVSAARESYQETVRPALVGLTDSLTSMQRRVGHLEERVDRLRSTPRSTAAGAAAPAPSTLRPPAVKPPTIAPDVKFRSESLRRAAEAGPAAD
jgi:hypothetical protein